MTATIAAADLDGVVKRADDRWARRQGDEPASPEYLEAIVNAVRPLLGQPVAAPVDDGQVQQLLDDKQRLGDLVGELRKQADTRGKIVERQARELTALKQDLGAADADARRRVDAAAEAMQAPLKAAQDEADKLRQALVLRTQELDEAREKLQARSAIIERREVLPPRSHRHRGCGALRSGAVGRPVRPDPRRGQEGRVEGVTVTAIRAAGGQAASPGAAYVIDASIVDVVHANLITSGLEVQAVQVGDGQLPRFNVFPAGVRISHLEQARRAKFTDCELQTLTLIAEGLSNPEIAQRLHVAVDTVKTNIRRVFRKLGVKDRAHAVAVGYQRGILGGA